MRRLYAGAFAVICWFALILQFILILDNTTTGISTGGRVVNFFSYFTILSNILAALMLTSAWAGRGGPFAWPGVQTAVTVYMTITGLVYTFILAGIWNPTGWDFVANALLHYVMPVAVVAFWVLFVSKGTLTIGKLGWMLVFPLVYAVYSLIRGPMANDWYPYPFLDVAQHGFGTVLLNCVAVTVAFVIVAAIYFGLDRVLGGMRLRRA